MNFLIGILLAPLIITFLFNFISYVFVLPVGVVSKITESFEWFRFFGDFAVIREFVSFYYAIIIPLIGLIFGIKFLVWLMNIIITGGTIGNIAVARSNNNPKSNN